MKMSNSSVKVGVPKFSIIIPTFNRSDRTLRSIYSCTNQTTPDFEVIVVDDASTDGTQEAVVALQDPRVKYFRQVTNGGAAKARNRGIAEARGAFIAFLDSDDEWHPEKLATISKYIDASAEPQKTLFYSRVTINLGSGVSHVRPRRAKLPGEKVLNYIMCSDGLIQTSTIVIGASAARRIRFDEELPYHNDYLFCSRAESHGCAFEMAAEPLAIWNCDDRPDRLSATQVMVKYFPKWLERAGDGLSPKALRAYRATHIAPRLGKPFQAVLLVIWAGFTGAISFRRFVMSLLAAVAPVGTYRRLIFRIVKLKERVS
jgi:glycosyltransferase involved in cell wall biosynthesis